MSFANNEGPDLSVHSGILISAFPARLFILQYQQIL